jgi:hypothetical protein
MTVLGHFKKGQGKAHVVCDHTATFGEKMVGTFNVRMPIRIERFRPSFTSPDGFWTYWPVEVNGEHEAWAVRWRGSKMRGTTWELISREPLPDILRIVPLSIEVKEPA